MIRRVYMALEKSTPINLDTNTEFSNLIQRRNEDGCREVIFEKGKVGVVTIGTSSSKASV